MSVIFNCGFARVAVNESFHKAGSASIETDPSERWKNYLAVFEVTKSLQSSVPLISRNPKQFTALSERWIQKAGPSTKTHIQWKTGKLLIRRRRNSTHCQIVKVVRCTIMTFIIFSPVEKLSSPKNFLKKPLQVGWGHKVKWNRCKNPLKLL